MTTLVIGALGATGRRVVEALAAQGGDSPVLAGVHRPGAGAPGAERRELDLTWGPRELESALTGVDTVVNAAAARDTSRADLVDRAGVVAAVTAARRAGVTRWVQVSMAGVDRPGSLPGFLIGPAEAKRAADEYLSRSGLEWTVIRPPWLTDGVATGRIVVDSVGDGSLSRADLVAVVTASLRERATIGRVFEVANGPTPIGAALSNLS
ncbi:NAD(P)H-binding protein [Nocardiopsis terrae]